MNNRDPRKNTSGLPDPTAYEALEIVNQEDAKFRKLLHTIFNLCELSGFGIQGRIVLVDEKTGRIWR